MATEGFFNGLLGAQVVGAQGVSMLMKRRFGRGRSGSAHARQSAASSSPAITTQRSSMPGC